jgi:uncharacterized protein (DUF1697 family)
VETQVVLIRGINVGGSHIVKMVDLAKLCAKTGATNVKTYIQSGNVVLGTKLAPAELEDAIESGIAKSHGFRPSVVVRTQAELAKIVSGTPYTIADGTKHVVYFGKDKLPAKLFSAFDLKSFAPEHFTVRGREMYLDLPEGQGRSKLVMALMKLKHDVPVTARNWNTVTKLLALASTP